MTNIQRIKEVDSQSMKNLTKEQKKQHKKSRDNRKKSRGKQWVVS